MSSSRNSLKPIIPPLDLIKDSPDSSDDESKSGQKNNNVQNGENENDNNREISPESGIDLASRGNTAFVGDEGTVMSTERTVIPPNELFNFDLTDPEEVVHMLETVDLSEEDTDVLLQEAYSVNMKLKEILRRKEKGENIDPSSLRPNVVVVPGASKKDSMSNSRNNSGKQRGQFSKAQPLPPISNGSSPNLRVSSAVYSAKLQRPAPPPSGVSSNSSQKRSAYSSVDRKPGSRNPSAAMVITF